MLRSSASICDSLWSDGFWLSTVASLSFSTASEPARCQIPREEEEQKKRTSTQIRQRADLQTGHQRTRNGAPCPAGHFQFPRDPPRGEGAPLLSLSRHPLGCRQDSGQVRPFDLVYANCPLNSKHCCLCTHKAVWTRVSRATLGAEGTGGGAVQDLPGSTRTFSNESARIKTAHHRQRRQNIFYILFLFFQTDPCGYIRARQRCLQPQLCLRARVPACLSSAGWAICSPSGFLELVWGGW